MPGFSSEPARGNKIATVATLPVKKPWLPTWNEPARMIDGVVCEATVDWLEAFCETDSERQLRLLSEALRVQLAAPASSPAALLVTQANCLAVVGLEPRKFLQVIRELGLPVLELGKVRAVRAVVLLDALAGAAVIARDQKEPADDSLPADRLARAAGLA